MNHEPPRIPLLMRIAAATCKGLPIRGGLEGSSARFRRQSASSRSAKVGGDACVHFMC